MVTSILNITLRTPAKTVNRTPGSFCSGTKGLLSTQWSFCSSTKALNRTIWWQRTPAKAVNRTPGSFRSTTKGLLRTRWSFRSSTKAVNRTIWWQRTPTKAVNSTPGSFRSNTKVTNRAPGSSCNQTVRCFCMALGFAPPACSRPFGLKPGSAGLCLTPALMPGLVIQFPGLGFSPLC